MFWKLTGQDIRHHTFSAVAIALFSGISVMLFTLSVLLFVNLLGAIDHLMDMAQTPDYLQMHAGTVSEQDIAEFAQAQDAAAWQVSPFLNLENGRLYLGEKCLIDSTQDNGLCIQNPTFDLLLDEQNQMPDVEAGEVYVPVCYRQEYGLQAGDSMQIDDERLVIAGFLRDAQMNSMMASSKRFLVCREDYERLREQGTEEYLIEFLLSEDADTGTFGTAYANAGLPANGPTITRGLIKMMNALSDGIMILLILLVSLLIFLISAVCIRFILLTRMEQEKKEIGMLRALGIDREDVRRLYFRKYALFGGSGAATGVLAAWGIYPLLAGKMKELYGVNPAGWQNVLFSLLGAVCVTVCILFFIRRVLARMERITALDALRGTDKASGGGPQKYVALIAAVCAFLLVIPMNLYDTMSSPQFVTYMGIGDGEIRIDVRQGEQLAEITDELMRRLAEDPEVEKVSLLQTRMLQMTVPEGTENILVESGDHTLFPVSYSQGRAPGAEGEIALSALQAEEISAEAGDVLHLRMDGEEMSCEVCGIYSDITNGGRTAKIYADAGKPVSDVMWNILYLNLREGTDKEAWMQSCRDWTQDISVQRGEQSASVKVISIQDYVTATYGQTLQQVRMASILTDLSALVILFVVVMLFLKLLIAKQRDLLSLEKALGCANRELTSRYLQRGTGCAAFGVAFGILLGNLLGERICAAALRSFGADGFRFVYTLQWTNVVIPAALLLTAFLAVWAAAGDIRGIRAYECCRNRE